MSKHTQGPWQQDENGNTIEISSPDFNVCIVQLGAPDDEAQARADACLIAAAPDMYELIEQLAIGNSEYEGLRCSAYQLLAKVTQS